jgi:D-glycero-alpha-D-manno-heptose-7-phosphate kinase
MMAGLVDQAAAILQGGGDLAGDLGNLMHESWMMKRELADAVSTPEIDAIYEKGREAGAAGGKLLGAGGGGFMLFVTRPEDRPQLSAALGELIQVSFDFDTGGSKIVVFEPDGFAKS